MESFPPPQYEPEKPQKSDIPDPAGQPNQPNTQKAPASPLAPPTPQRRRNRWLLPATAAVTVAAATAAGVAYLNGSSKSPMEMAYENCNGSQAFERVLQHAADEAGDLESTQTQPTETEEPKSEEDLLAKYFDGVLSLEDDGTTLIIDTLGQDEDPLGFGSVTAECVYIDLGTPKWVTESVSATRALDGRQSAEWDNYTAQWGYHPNSGLSMIITTTGK